MTVIIPGGIGGLLVLALIYVLARPDRAQIIAGWLWSGGAGLWRGADRKAVAYHVQGTVNEATSKVMQSNPTYVFKGKLRIKWTTASEAEAHMQGGDVVVFMQRASSRQQNVTRALMLYLPKAVLPRARRYVGRETMQAADLVLAKSILGHGSVDDGSMDDFYEEHMERACTNPDTLKRVRQLDDIDVHGWLGRVLLAEYYHLGDLLTPAEPREVWATEATSFADWLHRLSVREPGDDRASLTFQGRLISVSIVFVAIKARLQREGWEAYRQQAKRLLYQKRANAVYLMARDDNIEAVRSISESLSGDAIVQEHEVYEYPLRRDFPARGKLNRKRAIIVCLRRRQHGEAPMPSDLQDSTELTEEIFDVTEVEAELSEHTRGAREEQQTPQSDTPRA